jgi:tRNA(fMet)-specific endonuclease VapC
MIGTLYLIDSDVVADALKGRPQAVQQLSTLAPNGLAISLITYGEIYEGILYSQNPTASERVFRQFLRDVTVIPLTRPIMRRFAQLRGQLRAAGNIISDFDLLIAATAIHNNLALVSRNKKHFQRVPGLSLY